MKKKFCIITVIAFLTFLLVSAITFVNAQEYTRTSWPTQDIPTIDGMWTFETEWTDGEITMIGEDVAFRSTWDMQGSDVYTRWVVEFFSDTTNDTGDYFRFCIQGFPSQSSVVRKFEIFGHTDLVYFISGDLIGGQGWTDAEITEGEIEWATTLSASPTNSTPHWILEFQIDKDLGQITMDNVWNFLLGVNDASNPGFQSWPPTDPDNPESWGVENYSLEPIPEGLNLAVMVFLSSISLLIGSQYLRKHSKKREKQ